MIDVEQKSLGSEGPYWTRQAVDQPSAVILACPWGHHFMLFGTHSNHGIQADGTVGGSVLCQGRLNDPCGWHEHVRLIGWKP